MRKITLFIFAAVMMSACCCNKEDKCTPENEVATEINSTENSMIDCILSRRSIRAYKPEQVKEEELQAILNCGINAPSARNLQPWQVRVIQDKQVIDQLNRDVIDDMIAQNPDAKDRWGEDANIFYNAPTVIFIAYDTTNYWGMSDCGMLMQNMLLAAESMDLGTCVIGCCREYLQSEKAVDFVKTLNLPENYQVYVSVALGYKDQRPEAKPRDAEKVIIL